MPNFYRTSFDRLRLEPGFSKVLAALERGFQHFQIDYYLIGAVSRNVWLSGIGNIIPKRTTGDVDFAVFINDRGLYEQLKQYLIDKEKFQPYKENAFVLISEDGTEIDLMPFGAIEDENRKVTIQGTGFTSVHVEGFKEVYEQGLPQIEVDGGQRFKCCTLPGIVLLKLIAWDDRPEVRQDDIKDIAEILDHFFEINSEMIWRDHSDLFDTPNSFDDSRSGLLLISANVLGIELRQIARENEHLLDRLKDIIGRNAVDASSSKMAEIMALYFEISTTEALWLIREIEKGLTA
jgi:predicted nucleotidyltransferase